MMRIYKNNNNFKKPYNKVKLNNNPMTSLILLNWTKITL